MKGSENMSTTNLGVYPVFDLEFKIGIEGRESTESDMKIIKDMETFSPSIDGNVEEWTPMDTEGWIRRLMTGKGFAIALNGKRHVGDPGNDYVAKLAWKSGLKCSSKAAIVFPDGDYLEFDCIVNVTTPFGGDSTNVSGLEFELQSDGKPNYVSGEGSLSKLTFECEKGSGSGTTKIPAVVPVKDSGNSYMYKINGTLPMKNENLTGKGWTDYILDEDITVNAGNNIALVEATSANKAVAGGLAPAVVD